MEQPARARIAAGYAAIAAVVLLVYAPTLRYPFIQDDWDILAELHGAGTRAFLAGALTPAAKLFFRPVGLVYFALMHAVFGLNAVAYHAAALVIQAVNGILVARLASRFAKDPLVGWSAGIIYVTAVNIHLEPMLWIVGIYDLAAVLFALLAVDRYLAGRYRSSAFAMAAALLSKESAVYLFVALIVFATYTSASWKTLWRHGAITAGYLLAKAFGSTAAALDPSHPYYLHVDAASLRTTIGIYGRWGIDALMPLKWPIGDALVHSLAQGRWLALASAALVGAFGVYVLRAASTPHLRRAVACAAAWGLISILPVVPLVRHQLAYYLTPALPAMAILCAIAIGCIATALALQPRALAAVVIMWAAVATASSTAAVAASPPAGQTLIRRAQVVSTIAGALHSRFASVPRGSVFVFDGVDVASFSGSAGPRVWYGDPTLAVVEEREVACAAGVLAARDTAGARVELSRPDRVFWLRTAPEGVYRIDLATVRGQRCAL